MQSNLLASVAFASVLGGQPDPNYKPLSQMTPEEIAERERREEEDRKANLAQRERAQAFWKAERERKAKFAAVNGPIQAKRDKELYDRKHTRIKGKADKKAAKRYLRESGPL